MLNLDTYRWNIPEYDRPAHQKIFDTGKMHRDAYAQEAQARGISFDFNAPAWEWPLSFSDLTPEWQAAITTAVAENNNAIRAWKTRPTEWEMRGGAE